jgi:CRP-like cAMP-binding protein
MTNQTKPQRRIANKLLAAMPEAEYERLRPRLETVPLDLGQVIYYSGEPTRYAYFPESGTISLLSVTEDGLSLEVAIVGSEGMIVLPLAFGIDAALYQTWCKLRAARQR